MNNFVLSLLILGVFWAFVTAVMTMAGVKDPLIHIITTGISLAVFYIFSKHKEDRS